MAENVKTKWVRLGDLITQRREKNDTLDVPIRGVTSDGFIPPKQEGADTSLYNVFYKHDFVFNPARMELNSIALNMEFDKAICSSLYEIFFINNTDLLLPEYLNIFIKRDEFARFCWFDAIGSARNYFRVANMQDIEIPLPDIEVQRELVEVYNGLKELAEQNEALLPRLSAACHAYIVDCRDKYPSVTLGDYIEEYNVINSDNSIKTVKSVSVFKEFRDTNAKVNKEELSKYKIVQPGMMSYVQTTKNEKCFACCVNHYDDPIVVTSVNKVFYVTKPKELNIDFLFLFLNRKEFDRFAIFNSWGSAREVFQWEDLKAVQIPLPPIEVQQAIVDVYQCAERAKQIAIEARERMKNLCPALVQRAANS